ncbi:hypothetical protein Q8A67_020007 [Cirrhinus molitorella]|uniref:Uncharacterized protein n=1 Tax=Cirrhinus molitorella TaxID=172907 RepID=A0AA88PDF8_9TELE|nr:hypothetical protein Q8A67_020007 [Cirrhinus molitorella]
MIFVRLGCEQECASFIRPERRPAVVCGRCVYGLNNAVVVLHGTGASESGSDRQREVLTESRRNTSWRLIFFSVCSHQWHSRPSLSSPGQTKASHSSAVLWPQCAGALSEIRLGDPCEEAFNAGRNEGLGGSA